MSELRIQSWSMGRIAREMDARLVSPRIDTSPPMGVSTDTRSIESGELFVALRGERFDGHHFVAEAIERGAQAVVVEDSSAVADGASVPMLIVDDTLGALADLGRAIAREARQRGLHVVAVTGSNGKTTTKELLSAIWGLDGAIWATPGNLNNHIGVPLTLCAIPARCDHLIVEMGANHRGEIRDLIELVEADERIITSIGKAHLEGFGSMAGVRSAKSEILQRAGRSTTGIVPVREREVLAPVEFPGRILTFGRDRDADVCVESAQPVVDDDRTALEVHITHEEADWRLRLPFLGRHNATNLAAAMGTVIASETDFDEDRLNRALSSVTLPGGRFRVVEFGGLEILDDAYNANPASMRASYRAFEDWCGDPSGVRLAVIGGMRELGESANRDHRRLAEWIGGRRFLNGVAFVGEYAEVMARVADEKSGREVSAFEDHAAVARWLDDFQDAKVFIKGSRANRLERVVDHLRQLRD